MVAAASSMKSNSEARVIMCLEARLWREKVIAATFWCGTLVDEGRDGGVRASNA